MVFLHLIITRVCFKAPHHVNFPFDLADIMMRGAIDDEW